MLRLASECHAVLHERVRQEPSIEVGGLLVGLDRGQIIDVSRVVPISNRATDSTRFFMLDPDELVRTDRAARAESLEIVGTWHSHPSGPPIPSREDARFMARIFNGADGWLSLILGRSAELPGTWTQRAYRWSGTGHVEIPVIRPVEEHGAAISARV